MTFSFSYLSYGEVFYVFSDEGNYCAKVFDKWIIRDNAYSIMSAIDSYFHSLLVASRQED